MSSWNIYPRPTLVRDSFISLNGEWDFSVSRSQDLPNSYTEKITVPYPPQSKLSGVGRILDTEDIVYYRRTFKAPSHQAGERVILHFGAVDNEALVFINGKVLGEHLGGYLPFSFDITEHLREDNELTVKVIDRLDHDYPYGKQRTDRGGMWYTPTSGIWQTVWLEVVPCVYIERIKTDTDDRSARIKLFCNAQRISAELIDDGGDISVEGNEITVRPKDPKSWSPEDPYLYRIRITADLDTVESYFALRRIEIKDVNGIARICLNGEPYYFHALLDQGYFEDGIFLPGSPEGYTNDIELAKSFGFNTLRKHIKIEPEHFYYECDRLGIIVFQDFVNNSDYSFFRDTALPTIGFKRINDKRLKRSERAKEIFISHSKATVEHLYNHPSICLWTIFNEGWGQFDADRLYKTVKEWDDSRVIDATSGWFRQKESDVLSLHIYFKKAKLPKRSSRPMILSEFGGYCYAVKGHLFDEEKSYGYRNCKTLERYRSDFSELYREQIIPLIEQGLCASVYTQLCDVEEEINGIVTYDRKVAKLDREEALEISKKLKIT